MTELPLRRGRLELVDRPLCRNGRPIVGATVEVRDVDAVQTLLRKASVSFERFRDEEGVGLVVAPEVTGSIWVELKELSGNGRQEQPRR